MKKMYVLFLILAILAFCVSAAADPAETIQVQDGENTLTLGIQEYGFDDAHKSFYVTVSGYSITDISKSGIIKDVMPFSVAAAWSTDEYLVGSTFRITADPVITVIIEKEDHSVMTDPPYIIIAPKSKKTGLGYYYSVEDGLFHSVAEIDALHDVPVPEATAPGRNTRKGDCVTFGRYPQTAEGTDDTPIEWLVLDVKDGKALLLSRYALDSKPYNEERAETITWEECTLRQWLNGGFMDSAFSESERSAIVQTKVYNNSIHSPIPDEKKLVYGNNTQDHVFLLSYYEAVSQYFSDKRSKRCRPTAYAAVNGAEAEDERGTVSWSLRSPCYSPGCNALVSMDGGTAFVGAQWNRAVRPALWLNLESDLFGSGTETEDIAEIQEKEKLPDPEPFRKTSSIVTFGMYEKDGIKENGPEPIEWIVLDVQDNKALLLSLYGIDEGKYSEGRFSFDEELPDKTWEECTLREWLNDDFLNAAFSEAEQTAIAVTDVDNSDEQGTGKWDTSGGNNTRDKIFLLSCHEVFDVYFTKDNDRWCAPTDYAVKEGAYVKNVNKVNGRGISSWWLRSPGKDQKSVLYVDTDGAWYSDSYILGRMIRPAFWIDLDMLASGQ